MAHKGFTGAPRAFYGDQERDADEWCRECSEDEPCAYHLDVMRQGWEDYQDELRAERDADYAREW